MTRQLTPKFKGKLLAGVIAAIFISGCNEGSNNQTSVANGDNADKPKQIVDGDNAHTHSKGRLVISEKDQAGLRIIDLDDQNNLFELTMTHPVSYLQTSPDGRYAIAIQRSDHLVQFVDSGLWLEPHGDHMDLVEEAPSLLSYELMTTKPTHYNVIDHTAGLFSDGNKETGEGAGFYVFDDAGISNGQMSASHSFDYSVHGTLQIRGDYVLSAMVTDLDAQTNPTYNMPDSVALFEAHGDHLHQEQVFDVQCPGLHGSFQGESWTVFGCGDGILAIEQKGENFKAKKIVYPADFPEGVSIGTVKGNHHIDKFLGISRSQQTFLIDPVLGSIDEIQWKSSDNLTMKATAFDAHKELFVILDSEGYLTLFDVENEYSVKARFNVLTLNASSDAKHQMVTAASDNQLFITDPDNNSIVLVDLKTQKVASTVKLDFTPNRITWTGIKEPESAHTH